jgi:amino acid transporter
VLSLAACTGLIASFHTIIFAYGRQIYSLSRAGYFPRWLSVTSGRGRRRIARCLPGRRSGSQLRSRFI